MKRIVVLLIMLCIVTLLSCKKDKDNSISSQNAYTEQQQKILNVLPGKWGMDPDYYTSSDNVFYVFHEPANEDVIVYEEDYVNGAQELYRYQGFSTYIWLNLNTGDTVTTSDDFYYISEDGKYLTFYHQYIHDFDEKRHELKVTDNTHISLKNQVGNGWGHWIKIE